MLRMAIPAAPFGKLTIHLGFPQFQDTAGRRRVLELFVRPEVRFNDLPPDERLPHKILQRIQNDHS